ncbi:DNA repair protein REV1 [Armadillidium vulgare]|nr:DNA repair protein REV1 [Armadillidium vulgare]
MSSNGRGRGRKKRNRSETGFEMWGGYMAAKISKLQGQFKDEAGNSQERKGIFSGIAIFVNGYTNPTGEELKRLMIAHGGTYHHYYSRTHTTHIIASNLPNVKVQNMNTDFIVNPNWITESISAGKLLDYKNYLLYTHQNRSQPKLTFGKVSSSGGKICGESLESNVPSVTSESNNTIDEKYISKNTSTSNDKFSGKSSNNTIDEKYISKNTSTSNDKFSGKSSNNTIDEKYISKNTSTSKDKCSGKSSLSTSNFGKICGESLESNVPSVSSESNNTIDEKYTSKNTSTSDDKCSGKSSLSTANPNFLSEFYNNSRLHHISTSGAMFKQYVKELQIKEDNFIGREYLKSWLEERGLSRTGNSFSGSEHVDRTIMHIDMDCFFVSVGLINHPELVGQPVAVTHATRNSQPKRNEKEFEKEVNQWKKKYLPNDDVMEEKTKENLEAPKSKSFSLIDDKCSMAEIASCSYEARKRGVKNGMFLGVALKLCPELKTVSYDFEGYTKVSRDLYDIVASYTKNIEAVSCDEMYVDLVDILKECQCSPMDFATLHTRTNSREDEMSVFCGNWPQYGDCTFGNQERQNLMVNFFSQLVMLKTLCFYRMSLIYQVKYLLIFWWVGISLRARLEEKGVITCGDLQNIQLSSLQSTFGNKTGKSLYELCRGIDNRPINKEHQRKSVSAEVNYGIRFEGWSDAEKFVSDLSEEASKRLVNVGMKGRKHHS